MSLLRKKSEFFTLVYIFIFVLFFLTSCFSVNYDVIDVIPDTDIVYQQSDSHNQAIGFIDNDGLNQTTLFLDHGFLRPVWSSDGKRVYGIYSPSDSIDHWGQIATLQEGEKYRLCKNNELFNVVSIGTVIPADDSHQVLLTSPAQWLLFDLDTCKILKAYIRPGDNQTVFAEQPSISLDGQQIVYAEVTLLDSGNVRNTIKILKTNTMEIRSIGEIEEEYLRSPRLSPDEQWVAYRGNNGVSIIAIDGTQKRLLISYPMINPQTGRAYQNVTLEPYWSPDSKWIVYHKCMQPNYDCNSVEDFSIFKVNIVSGEEIKIVDGGLFPYWRQ